jgi:hypothetical protein
MQTELHVQHILVKLDANVPNTLKEFKKITNWKIISSEEI